MGEPARSTFRIVDVGDSCVALELDPRVDPQINGRCAAIARRVRTTAEPGVRDVVATYHAVAVHFDPLETRRRTVVQTLTGALALIDTGEEASGRLHEIPVCYGGAFGPDLADVARQIGLTTEEVVRRHANPHYRVYMMGFLPGFAYLGVLDDQLRLPRRSEPRLRVEAGSVAVAGAQTGVYPVAAPGGWHIIGRTPRTLFDASRAERAFVFEVGDRVQFMPIDRWPGPTNGD